MTEWMKPEDLATLTGLSTKRLANLRAERRRFPFYRPEGSKSPLYDRAEVDAIIASARVEVRP